ncbi:fasciclin domain-containing protein [Rhodovarius lipocyclicus]|uniref:fasciclin domain-containing protein n=1 Tax=Rhodovarius lipocyclicus TaxID=268410 RepID=UPI00135A1135|nr:fasciclin domain-containing protein [Rhodovarius lipocyclicus]
MINKRRHFLSLAAASAGMIPLGALAQATIIPPAGTPMPAPIVTNTNVADALAADGRFTRFLEFASQSGAIAQLREASMVTVFAPIDIAMERLPATLRDQLLGTPGTQRDVVRLPAFVNLHIVDGVETLPSLAGKQTTMRSRNGTMLVVKPTEQSTLVLTTAGDAGFGSGGANATRSANILMPVIQAANGMILPIDNAMLA